jgi:hypothetical protein
VKMGGYFRGEKVIFPYFINVFLVVLLFNIVDCEILLGYVYLFYLWVGLDLYVLSFDSNRSPISCETLFSIVFKYCIIY